MAGVGMQGDVFGVVADGDALIAATLPTSQ
jgi:hypothetical protein